jgi:D-alanyl-D-alanine carboxypeptidase/D-alanyl-D-alanine-endopeptidase (penicillin-binding protein 4)
MTHLRSVMGKALQPLGGHSSAYAIDLDTGQVLYDYDATVARNPASVEKLYTLTTALAKFGPNATLQTTVYAEGHFESGGLFVGNLYLRGGGDPTFGDLAFDKHNYGTGTTVTALARLIQQTGIRKVKGSIIGDESYFDSRRGGPATNYAVDSNLVGQLSALAFDRGEQGSTGSPAAYAAFQLAGALRHDGVVVTGRSKAGLTDLFTAKKLVAINSPPMSTLVRLTAVPSDDFFAEMLLKALGARFGAGGTTADGAAVVTSYLAGLHLRPTIVDGSGLSRGDRTSPLDVVTLLRDLSPGGIPSLESIGVELAVSLPIVSETGTLEFRMHHTAASGHCDAKTGTLSDVSDLAGWCNGTYAFAFLMDDVNVWTAETAQDALTVALAKLSVPTG